MPISGSTELYNTSPVIVITGSSSPLTGGAVSARGVPNPMDSNFFANVGKSPFAVLTVDPAPVEGPLTMAKALPKVAIKLAMDAASSAVVAMLFMSKYVGMN